LIKMLRKFETLSEYASFVMRGTAAANTGIALLLAFCLPWLPFVPTIMHADLFLIVYLLVLMRFLTIVASLDTSSPFGGFGAAREIVLPVLAEPAGMLCLSALCVMSKTSDLSQVFSFGNRALIDQSGVWFLAGCGMYMASLIELSRMPADDPTTHLELTMTHEALILENSGPNLGLTEYAHAVKLSLLMGMAGQCWLHSLHAIYSAPPMVQNLTGFVALLFTLVLTALIESSAVKLRWTKLPEFISYAVTFGLLCAVFVLGV
jgi:formate hydrogenlyase subunit 4